MPLMLELLKKYCGTDMLPMHMPGHKRKSPGFPDPYTVDITEIHGFDSLMMPQGIYREKLWHIAKIYGAKKSYVLVNGSSCGIEAAINTAAKTDEGLLLARNCHLSAFYGAMMGRQRLYFVNAESIEKPWINGAVSAENVEKALQTHNDIKAVLVVSPTYEGIVSDIEAIAKAAHSHGAMLIVDEAHGAHLPFASGNGFFPESALHLGADIVIQSLHKTLPALTQTAILHVAGDRVDIEKLEHFLRVFQTTSPSYVLFASAEYAVEYAAEHGREAYAELEKNIKMLRKETSDCKNLWILRCHNGEKEVFAQDPSKVVLTAEDISGKDMMDFFREEEHVELEMHGAEHALALLSCMDDEKNIKRLAWAVKRADKKLAERKRGERLAGFGKRIILTDAPKCIMSMADAWASAKEYCGLKQAAGKICGEFVYAYPPGIPLLMPGEEISAEAVEMILTLEAGGCEMSGISGNGKIKTVTKRG